VSIPAFVTMYMAIDKSSESYTARAR
jgi:hypothetical protein